MVPSSHPSALSPLSSFFDSLQQSTGTHTIDLQMDNARGSCELVILPTTDRRSNSMTRWNSSSSCLSNGKSDKRPPRHVVKKSSSRSTAKNATFTSTRSCSTPVDAGVTILSSTSRRAISDSPVVRPRRRLSGDMHRSKEAYQLVREEDLLLLSSKLPRSNSDDFVSIRYATTTSTIMSRTRRKSASSQQRGVSAQAA
jgi:hypothetical protein